jgi:tetratricopeptide (TPR) repeat protein
MTKKELDQRQKCLLSITREEDIALPALFTLDAAIARLEKLAKVKSDYCTEQALQKLAFIYSLKKDFLGAERAFDRWERLNFELAIAERAFFHFAMLKDFDLAISDAEYFEKKIPRAKRNKSRPWWRTLHVKGRSLLALGKKEAAAAILSQILLLAEFRGENFQFELDFVEELVTQRVALSKCRRYLEIARWPDEGDWHSRAARLLKRLGSPQIRR